MGAERMIMLTKNRAAATALLAMLLAPGAGALEAPQLLVEGGAGRRGEPVDVVIRLVGDAAGAAVSADLDIDFPTDLLAFTPPVPTSCAIAPRLAETHEIGGQLLAPGQLTLAIFVRGVEINPLGDGELATCTFEILPDADRTPAALELPFASLNDATGHMLPLDAPDGLVRITDAPGACVADCDGDGVVAVNEVIRGVNIALGNQDVSECPAADADGDGMVTISELIAAVNDVIAGC